jgi:hypothetical protein
MSQETVDVLAVGLGLLCAGLLAVLIPFARKIALRLASLADIKLEETHLQQLDRAVAIGIGYAEEQAVKKLRGLVPDGPVNGEQKLEVAKSAARSIAPAATKDVSEKQLEIAIEGQLKSLIPPAGPSASLPPLRASFAPSSVFSAATIEEVETRPDTPNARRK